MRSQYTRPGVAISVAQQEALYREYLKAQQQQSLSYQKVEQAHSLSGGIRVNPVNQVPVDAKKTALPPLQPPMHATSPATDTRYGTNELQYCT